MNNLDTLIELFVRFPGIGPRQARRFVFFLLRQDSGYRSALIRAIQEVANQIQQCTSCLRYAPLQVKEPICAICANTSRSSTQVMVVEKDTDVDQMEKSGEYHGRYFVLGSILSLSGKKRYIREKELLSFIKNHAEPIEEIILALSTTSDGEYTTSYLSEKLTDIETLKETRITILGRGLSTGAELEYADATTLTQALKNRY